MVGHGARIPYKHWPDSTHAEAAAVHKLLTTKQQHLLVGSSLFVTRVNNKGQVMLSLPCPNCQQLIRAVGIKKVFYTTNEGETKIWIVK